MGRRTQTLRRIRRLLRSPVLVVLLALLFLADTVRIIHITSSQTASLHTRSPPANTKRIYIASQHYNNAGLLRDRWNTALVDLVHELGPKNVFVSIYESGSWDDTKGALNELDNALNDFQVPHRIDMSNTTHKDELVKEPTSDGWVRSPHGSQELRRIPFLANLRNRVLEPLRTMSEEGQHFDLVLFLNDVIFTPSDVLTLLDTNNGNYAAACSLDFIKPPYYYDTFALRDSDGHETAMSTWPYFRSSTSRRAMERFQPVPVTSCWNGMVAMPVEPFLASPPLRFRAIPDSLAASHLEGSECCLIHADNPLSVTKGLYLNPNVKVGYTIAAYEAINAPEASLSSIGILEAKWKNRILRWTTTPLLKEWIVRGRVKRWEAGTEGKERGLICLINEMQVLMEKGWKHV
ncbi:glycosyltransferase family 69 protein [Aaosphaeria arxii CBS 175.79]|uniref:Glycosyltransferase family 69 protein n=1 Tax=Aaosphaeria arxii CBS 175.79 TaxID=1450172 RepID=A0A6A5YCG1_9PLEO|nr:glycosyltransferase family 69 protein [Aaosphaeria arxii CBS 175.79]KAF2022271.1 glycosyltransferase family 69 protein [Aaosphaeria arxii CBS 175.79]